MHVLFQQPRMVFAEIDCCDCKAEPYLAVSRIAGVWHVVYRKPDFSYSGRGPDRNLTKGEAARLIDAAMRRLGEKVAARATAEESFEPGW
jgi:hypothetical protein